MWPHLSGLCQGYLFPVCFSQSLCPNFPPCIRTPDIAYRTHGGLQRLYPPISSCSQIWGFSGISGGIHQSEITPAAKQWGQQSSSFYESRAPMHPKQSKAEGTVWRRWAKPHSEQRDSRRRWAINTHTHRHTYTRRHTRTHVHMTS